MTLTKCTFAQIQLEYLGHVVSGKGVEPVPEKLQAIQEWPRPHTAKALRSFLGLVGFYRRFIRGYAKIAAPLSRLLGNGPFQWTETATEAFEILKKAVSTAPVLTLPNFDIPFVVETDASGTGVRAILSQASHPIAFFSKEFCPKLRASSTYIRELAAITMAVKKWRHYLLGHPFVILTNHPKFARPDDSGGADVGATPVLGSSTRIRIYYTISSGT